MTKRRTIQLLLIALYLAVAAVPATVFFSERGFSAVFAGDASDAARKTFPLFGLYALFLLWAQILLGSLMPWVSRIFPKIFIFHRTEGIVAFLFAVTHPLLLLSVVGPRAMFEKSFVTPERAVFVTLGQLALLLLALTVGSALLMRLRMFRRVWRKIHVVNYAVFALAWVHSWNLGTDVRFTMLKWLWLGYGVTAAAAFATRLLRLRSRPRVPGAPVPQSLPRRQEPSE